MRMNSTRFARQLAMGVALAAILPGVAMAQAADAGDDAKKTDADIVVTGTLIRGTQVTGSQTIGVQSDAILQKGAVSTNEVLSLIPQISNTFNGRFEGDPRGISAGISINKPNLRNLPGFNASSGGTTLVLMDGFRMTPVGVNQSAIDVDIIPAAVLSGVDVVTDGGSSLYGADAVSGVINFRTKKKADGVKIDANYGIGTTIKHFGQWDASVTAGTSWSSGNAYVSAGHSYRSLITNGETSWATGQVYNSAGVASNTGTQCLSPVGSETRYFRIPGRPDNASGWTSNPLAPGAGVFPIGNACDQFSSQTYLPKQSRWNVFASLSQTVSDNVDLHVTAYWTKRDTTLVDYPRGYTTPSTTPVFPTGQAGGTIFAWPGGIGFSFGANSAYVNTPTRIGFETWGVTPELTVDLGHGWKMRNTLHYGESYNHQAFPAVNNTLAQSYVDAGKLNPLNAAAASASVVTDILDYENAQKTNQQMFDFRSIVDGSLFSLGSGDAKLAIGVEYQSNMAKSHLATDRVGAVDKLPWRRSERNSKSVFAELNLPLASFLDVAGSLRYDTYSDFGSTTNPSIGMTLRPTSWLKVFGHWNTSFNAPTAVDDLGIAVGRLAPGASAATVYDPLHKWNGTGNTFMILEGATPGLKPQTAHSWALGFEATPVDGLRFGGEFYSIDFKNVLGAVNPTDLSTYEKNPDLYIYNPSSSYFSDLMALLTNGAALSAQVKNTDIALIVDRRTTNISQAKLEGVDFHVNYDTDTSFGHIAFGLSGTELTRALLTTGSSVSNQLANGGPRFTASSFLGWKKGGLSTRVTVNYSGTYHDSGVNYLGQVEQVDPFVQTNLFVGYDFADSSGALKGTSLRLTVDNVFEAKPQPIKRGAGSVLSYNNWTLGRVIKMGFSKQF